MPEGKSVDKSQDGRSSSFTASMNVSQNSKYVENTESIIINEEVKEVSKGAEFHANDQKIGKILIVKNLDIEEKAISISEKPKTTFPNDLQRCAKKYQEYLISDKKNWTILDLSGVKTSAQDYIPGKRIFSLTKLPRLVIPLLL